MDVTKPTEISNLLAKYGIKVRKSWGQNFLISKTAVENILQAANLSPDSTVVEVGPGLGVMTGPMLDLAGQVVAIEIDPLLCRVLKDRFANAANFRLIHGDALEQDISKLVSDKYIVVANLPYYITSPFIAKLIEEQQPQAAIFLVQWEVAKRLTALPGTSDYGALSVLVQYYTDARLLHKIGPGNFFPPPKVDSAVVRLDWRPPVKQPKNEKLMFKLVRTAFSQRRKMFKGLLAKELGLPTQTVAEMLESMGLNPDIRGEKLSVDDFVVLADIVEVR